MNDEQKLPFDYCRCQGKDCDRKAECLRVEQMSNMGPRTPWTERYCPDFNTSEGFIGVDRGQRPTAP